MQTNILFGHISLIYSRMRNILSKSCRENQDTHIVYSITFFLNLSIFYEKVWKNNVDPDDNMMQAHAGYVQLQTHP